MEIIYEKIGFIPDIKEDICLAIGNFDGVHKGHQEIIKYTINSGLKSMIMTFDHHPNSLLKKNNFSIISSISEKKLLIERQNPDYLFIIKTDLESLSFSKEDFILWLKKMNVKKIICGHDFRFGKDASGSILDLIKEFNVNINDDVLANNLRISSTKIKEYMTDGLIEKANNLLGYNYFILGQVIHGSKIGALLGFPTANISISPSNPLKKGVYAVKLIITNKEYYGMANIGNNPTCNYQLMKRLEVFIFDFDDKIYDETIKVSFLKYIREEKKFSSINDLIYQLNDDKVQIIKWLLINK